MKTHTSSPTLRTLVVAIQAALLALGAAGAARASDEDDAVRELTQPTNYVEVGALCVSDDSFKFGEYNGLADQGGYGIFNFGFGGGGAYDSDSAVRWRVEATNLGLDTRELRFEYADQGLFRLDLGYDELRRNRSDSYQTPYLGAGTSVLTLPSSWRAPRVPQVNANSINFRSLSPASSQTPAIVGGATVQPTAAQLQQMAAIAASDTAAFHEVDLGTKRKRTEAGLTYQISPRWDVRLSAQSEDRTGLKPLGTVSSQVSEFSAIIPDKIDQTTEQYNVTFGYTADKLYAQFGYYGSIFDNHVRSMTWQDVNDPTKSATMSSAPSNEYHQFHGTAGYRFSNATKLVVNAAYARNTQDERFLVNPQLPLGVPVDSLDGKVITKSFDARLTSRPWTGLNLLAGFKFDDHNNETPVNTYIFQDANEARASGASAFNAALGLAPNTLGSNINIYANRPYSKLLRQADGSADWTVSEGQHLKAAVQFQQIDRKCNGSWINCADAPRTDESLGTIEWRTSVIEDLTTSLSYTYSHRNANYDENAFLALVPMANVIPTGGATQSVYQYILSTGLTGFGPYAGFPTTPLTGDAAIFSPNNNIIPQALYGSRNNINELLGLRRYNMADRNRDKVRAKASWQASEKLSLDGSVDYDNDDYNHSLYGLTASKNWALNLEAGYSISDHASSTVFYTYEDRKSDSAARAYGSNSNTAFVGVAANTIVSGGCFDTVQARNNNAKIDSCLDWTSDSKDKVHTFGVGLNFKDLVGGKLALSGDLVGTRARTRIGITGGSYVNNPLAAANQPPVTPAVYFIPAADLPTVRTDTLELRLNGRWKLNKSSEVDAFYWYAHLKSKDYAYDGMQFGSITNVMPSLETAPGYNLSVIGVSYTYHWQ